MSKKLLFIVVMLLVPALSFAATLKVPGEYATIALALAKPPVSGDIISIAGSVKTTAPTATPTVVYAENITVGVAGVILKCSSPDSLAKITGGATGTTSVNITFSSVKLENIWVDGSTKVNVPAVTIATGVNTGKLYSSRFTNATAASLNGVGVSFAGAHTGWDVENCTFAISSTGTGAAGIRFIGAAAVTSIDIIGNTFSGAETSTVMNYAVWVSDNLTEFSGINFGGNTVSKATFIINFDDVAGVAHVVKNVKIDGNVFTQSNAVLIQTTGGADVYELSNSAANTMFAAGGQVTIRGNHFGSTTTDGDNFYAIDIKGFGTNDITEENVIIQYNNFQYPMTTGTDTKTYRGHVTVSNAAPGEPAAALTKFNAQYNWWGKLTGPLEAYEGAGLAVVKAAAYDYTNFIATYQVPQIDNTNRGINIYDYDGNGHIDRAVIFFDYYLDPATVSSNAGWSVALGSYTLDTSRTPKLSLDNDNEGTPDGTDALTLFLVEKSDYDTGITPDITYANATGTVAGITGNSGAKLANVSTAAATEHDKAKPVIKSAVTNDADKDGHIDKIIVTFSEDIALTPRTADDETDWNNNISFDVAAVNYVDGLAAASDAVVSYALTEKAAYDTDLKPAVTTVADGSDDFVDGSGNLMVAVTSLAVTTDGAPPIAYIVSTRDDGATLVGASSIGRPDGYIDGFDITFSEAVAIAAADTALARGFTVAKVENDLDLSTAAFTVAAKVLTVKGKSSKNSTGAHPFDTDALPDLTYVNAGGIKDAAGLAWATFWQPTALTSVTKFTETTDTAKPVIALATAQVDSKNLYVTFSESVNGTSVTNAADPLFKLLLAGDLTYVNVYNTGTNAIAIAAIGADDDATDAMHQVLMETDEIILLADAQNDSVKVTTGLITDGSANAADVINVSIYDGIKPTLTAAQTQDVDADGWIDHIKLTFSEALDDAKLAGYLATNKISENAATWWAVQGYTVVGLNFVTDGTEQTAATTDATTRALTAALDGSGKVINVGDTTNDNILWLMVREVSGADAADGDTDAVPALTVTGTDTNGAKVGDFTPNWLETITALTTADKAGAAVMSAALLSEYSMQVTMSEAVSDTLLEDAGKTGTFVGAELVAADFDIHVGTAWMAWSSVKDITQTAAGVLLLTWPEDYSIPRGNDGYIGLSGAGVVNDLAGNGNTQVASQTWSTGLRHITAAPAFVLSAPSALTITDVANDNGHWVLANFVVSTSAKAKSYQFYTRANAEAAWALTAWCPKGIVDANNKMLAYVPVPVNGTILWAIAASSGESVSSPSAAKAGDIVVASLVEPGAAKVAEDVVVSALSDAVSGGAVDDIAPTALAIYSSNDNAGAGAGIRVSWTAPADHAQVGQYGNGYMLPIYGVDKYEVYRRTSATADFQLVGFSGALATSYVDQVADGITVYEYMIKYMDGNPDHTLQTSSVWAIANANKNKSDFSSDGVVNFNDFDLFVGAYGKAAGAAGWVSLYDLAPNGKVDFDDFDAFVGDYGFGAKGVAKVAVETPESNIAFALDAKVDAASSMYYITLNMSDITSIKGFEVTMNYDTDALELVKESIVGPVGLIIPSYENGVINIADMFNGEEFGGTLTIGFKTIGTNRGVVAELTHALVADNALGVSKVTDITNASLRALPTVYSLSKNFPNPFNPTTTIEYQIPASGSVDMVIYNMTGQKIRTLVNEAKSAGFYKVVWDGKNEMGESVASGLYFYKLVSGNFNKIEKMTLVK